ncbi:hypothetical protein GMRT_jh014 [Giardia muris]|uniref:Uncharacterized protein n=1 Tax=Giardia muris TaxID=5742 RepID=A0A4Z1SNK3_GIAMU|nr:hypothetical protein GMRT_jh014 [Giardia muris]|eukprot:TNJ27364.1 hypothetical protein GMRT_jh014 [Giardia muris]
MPGEELRARIIERNHERVRNLSGRPGAKNVMVVVPLVDSDTVGQTIDFVTRACKSLKFTDDATGIILVRHGFVEEMQNSLTSISGKEGSLRVITHENRTSNARAWKQAKLKLQLDLEQIEKLLATVHDFKFVPDVYIDDDNERE